VFKHLLLTHGLSTTRRLPTPMSTTSHFYRPVTIIAIVTRIIRKEDLNASMVSYNYYKLNAQEYSIINKASNIKGKDFGGIN
jgi:hypothetical protein